MKVAASPSANSEEEYRSGSELSDTTGSYATDDSFTNYNERKSKISDHHTRRLWSSTYHYFKSNKPGRCCGYRNFPFHLAAYVYWRNDTCLGGLFNPTDERKISIHNNDRIKHDLSRFCNEVLKMSGADFGKFLCVGSAIKFKRALQPRKVDGEKKIDPEYAKVKERFEITAF